LDQPPKKENHRAGTAPRASAHASRWAADELAEHAPRPLRLRAERRAGQRPHSGRTRVGQACYYSYDAHGNITFLTDATGAVTDSYDYDGWGNIVASTGSTANTRLYAGEELDPDLGLLNLRARQYKPGTGRFWTIDPVMGIRSQPVTMNRYLYANSDPANMTDPSGTMALELAGLLKGVHPIDASLFFFNQALGFGAAGAVAAGGGRVAKTISATALTYSWLALPAAKFGIGPEVAATGLTIACIYKIITFYIDANTIDLAQPPYESSWPCLVAP